MPEMDMTSARTKGVLVLEMGFAGLDGFYAAIYLCKRSYQEAAGSFRVWLSEIRLVLVFKPLLNQHKTDLTTPSSNPKAANPGQL